MTFKNVKYHWVETKSDIKCVYDFAMWFETTHKVKISDKPQSKTLATVEIKPVWSRPMMGGARDYLSAYIEYPGGGYDCATVEGHRDGHSLRLEAEKVIEKHYKEKKLLKK